MSTASSKPTFRSSRGNTKPPEVEEAADEEDEEDDEEEDGVVASPKPGGKGTGSGGLRGIGGDR